MLILYIYIFFFLLISLFSILVSNPVLSVLCLVFVFVLSSSFIIAIGLDYLGILLLLIYVGAISVLFLFVVMMLNVRQTELNQSLIRFWWLGLLICFFFFFELILCAYDVWQNDFRFLNTVSMTSWLSATSNINNIELLGEFLFFYNWDFLIIAVLLLLVAVIGPVYISQIELLGFYKKSGIDQWVQVIRSKVEYFS